MSDGTVNAQVMDGVASIAALSAGTAPAQAFAMLDAVMAETLGMAMYNAVARQQGSSMIGSAAVTATCAKMLGAPFGLLAAPPPPDPPLPGILPLAPVPMPPSAVIAAATADAEAAVEVLRAEEAAAAANLATAQANLARVAVDAVAPPSPPPPPSPPAPPPPGPVPAEVEATPAYVPPGGVVPVAPIAPPAPPAVATSRTTHIETTETTKPVIPVALVPDEFDPPGTVVPPPAH